MKLTHASVRVSPRCTIGGSSSSPGMRGMMAPALARHHRACGLLKKQPVIDVRRRPFGLVGLRAADAVANNRATTAERPPVAR